MRRIQLIHGDPAAGAERADVLVQYGYQVEVSQFGRTLLPEMRASPPDAVVIDLSRQPSVGRDVAVNIRIHKATRDVPIVFVGGDPGKVDRIRELLPDATYTTWAGVGGDLRDAIAHPPGSPFVPASAMAAYRGTPLVKKLGVKPGATVTLVAAPDGFEQLLAGLPENAEVRREHQDEPGLTLWFVRSKGELEAGIAAMVPYAEGGGLWIIWPKKSSGVVSDVSQTVVRGVGLAAGLVDFKVCSVDPTWSGLRFTIRAASKA